MLTALCPTLPARRQPALPCPMSAPHTPGATGTVRGTPPPRRSPARTHCSAPAPAQLTDRRVFKVVKAVVCQDEPAPLPRLHPSSWEQREAVGAALVLLHGTARHGTAALQPTRTHTDKQRQAAHGAGRRAAGSTQHAGSARAWSGKQTDEDGGRGRWEGRDGSAARLHQKPLRCGQRVLQLGGVAVQSQPRSTAPVPRQGRAQRCSMRNFGWREFYSHHREGRALPQAHSAAVLGLALPPHSQHVPGTSCSAQRCAMGVQAMLPRLGTKKQCVREGNVLISSPPVRLCRDIPASRPPTPPYCPPVNPTAVSARSWERLHTPFPAPKPGRGRQFPAKPPSPAHLEPSPPHGPRPDALQPPPQGTPAPPEPSLQVTASPGDNTPGLWRRHHAAPRPSTALGLARARGRAARLGSVLPQAEPGQRLCPAPAQPRAPARRRALHTASHGLPAPSQLQARRLGPSRMP